MNFRSYIRNILHIPTSVKNCVVLRLHGVNKNSGCSTFGRISIINKGQIFFGGGVYPEWRTEQNWL